MVQSKKDLDYSRYEVARILGARALQIAMDAPLLVKMDDKELEEINYDSIKIAEKEFYSGVLPITVKRPMPIRAADKLEAVKEEKIEDEKIIEKEKEIEEEIKEKAEEMGFADQDEKEDSGEEENNSENY